MGREKVKWNQEVWERIDRAVNYEFRRTRIAARFLPHHRIEPHMTTVPQDQILSSINGSPFTLATTLANAPAELNAVQSNSSTPTLLPNIDEAATTRLIEIWVEFSLTAQQVEQENTFKPIPNEEPEDQAHPGRHKHHHYSTAVTLATRAANILSQAQDAVLFQGQVATGFSLNGQQVNGGPLFSTDLVQNRGIPGDFGLLGVAPPSGGSVPPLPAQQVVAVPSIPPTNNSVQEITINGVTSTTTGNFTLNYGSPAQTATITWATPQTATPAAFAAYVQTQLQALNNIGAGNVVVSPGSLTSGLNGTIVVTFVGGLATTATAITIGANNLVSGGTTPATVSVGVPARYVEHTVGAITKAYSLLQAAGHYGPYAAVLYFYPYADTYAPLPTTLILPADRINPLMTEGFYGTGSLPGIPNPVSPPPATEPLSQIPYPANSPTQSMGLVVSTGGNTMDLVIGQEPITAFSQLDQNGNHLFRVLTRFALRLKDPSAVIRLEFQ